MKTQWPAQPTPDTTVWRPVRVMSSEITAGDAFIQTTWWLGTVQRTGEALEHFQKKEQEGSKEERSERRRRRQPPSRGGALRQAVQNHPRESQFRCRWMTGTIAGRVGVQRCRKIHSFSDIEMTVLFWQSSKISPCRIRFSFMIEYLYNFNLFYYRIVCCSKTIGTFMFIH